MLRIVSARALKSADMFDDNPGSDPYVQVWWNGELIGRTRVVEDCCDPGMPYLLADCWLLVFMRALYLLSLGRAVSTACLTTPGQ